MSYKFVMTESKDLDKIVHIVDLGSYQNVIYGGVKVGEINQFSDTVLVLFWYNKDHNMVAMGRYKEMGEVQNAIGTLLDFMEDK